MASPSAEYLNNVWQFVPQGHEKPLKQAFYNTIANIFVVFAAAAVTAVYFVFSPFLRPLCWALLCGTFLYPFKRRLKDLTRGWLQGLRTSGTPFFVGLVILPVQVVATTTATLSEIIWANFVRIVAVLAGLVSLQLFFRYVPMEYLAETMLEITNVIHNFVGYFSTLWVWTLVIAYFLVVAVYWRPESRDTIQLMAVPVLVVVLLHIAAVAGPLRVPLLFALVALMVVGSLTGKREKPTDDDGEGGEEQPSGGTVSSSGSVKLEPGPVLSPSSSTVASSTTPSPTPAGVDTGPTKTQKPSSLRFSERAVGPLTSTKDPADNKDRMSFSTQCFEGLLWAHILVRLWMHVWLMLLLLLLPLIYRGLKILGSTRLVDETWTRVHTSLASSLRARQEALIPRSVWGIGKLFMQGDRKLIGVLITSLDSATSTLMILMLLVGTCVFSIIAFVQVQNESMYIVTVTRNIFNNTVNHNITQWLESGLAMQDTMDTVVDKAYVYGRGFISSKVHEFLGGVEGTNVTLVEIQVLEVWDQVYNTLFSKVNCFMMEGLQEIMSETALFCERNGTTAAPLQSTSQMEDVWALWNTVSSRQLLDIRGLIAFAQDNIGTLMSVLDSVWLVIRGNMNLLITILTSTLSIVFGGGTAILNFVVSVAIFLTTLFYLLAFSGQQYKPVEFFSGFSLSSGSTSARFGQAVEEAISGVFMASLKMSAFYGLYTWLLHLIFALNIIFIPSALAAVFAAIPFVGVYWACLPGVVDLWLVQGKGLAAALCLIAHILPSYFVDTAIYREINQGHPFLTGLAIAGGMYCMGLEGAILGPILLCCLIVLITMYGNMLRSDTPTTGQSAQIQSHDSQEEK